MPETFSLQHRRQFVASMLAELGHAYRKHGSEPWGRHEFYGVIKEEVDELWDAIKADKPIEDVLREAMQVACDRFNAALPVGSEVHVEDDRGNIVADTVKYPASIMGGHTPVAWLTNKGSYRLERVRKAEKAVI